MVQLQIITTNAINNNIIINLEVGNMKTYTIGEAICNFELDTVGYIFKGKIEGALIWVDLFNQNRLVMRYPNGDIEYGVHIGVFPDMPKEEARNIVFVKELLNTTNEEEMKILIEAQTALSKLVKDFEDGLAELEPDERNEILSDIAKKHGEVFGGEQ
jgi:hypothetical protein